MKKESLKFIDLMSIGTVIWDLLGINLYFWGGYHLDRFLNIMLRENGRYGGFL